MATHPPVRAAIYLRQSLDQHGDGLAIERQRQACRDIAVTRGWNVVQEYVDASVSATDAKKTRNAYEQLVTDYRASVFDALICWDLDRLTRQPRQLEDWIDAATDRGLLLVTANGEADLSTDAGRLFARIKASVARSEVERKSARQKAAAVQRSDLGRPPLGVRLTGYTTRGDLVTAEADIIREVFRRFDAGDSLRSLATWLDTTTLRPRRSTTWNTSSVRGILTNPRYAGRAIYQGTVTGRQGNWQALVESSTFDVIQARLNDPRRRTHTGTDRKHLGSGLYVCGICGQPVTSWTAARYRCRAACVNRTQHHVDDYVTAIIRGRLARPDLSELLPPQRDPTAATLAARVTQLYTRLTVIGEDYDAGRIDGHRYAVATEKVKAEIHTAENDLARATEGRGAAALLVGADPVAAFDNAPLMLRRAIVDLLCRVELHPAPKGRKAFDPATVQITWK